MACRRAPASACRLPPRFATRRSGCSAAPPRLPADGRERTPTARQLSPSLRRSQIQRLMQAFRSVRLGPTRHVVLPVHSPRLHSGHAPLRLSPRSLAASPRARAAASWCSTSSCSSCSDHLGESKTCRTSILEECRAAAHCPLPARHERHRCARRRTAWRRPCAAGGGTACCTWFPGVVCRKHLGQRSVSRARRCACSARCGPWRSRRPLFWAISSPAAGATQPRGPWASGASFVSMFVPIYVFLVVRCARW